MSLRSLGGFLSVAIFFVATPSRADGASDAKDLFERARQLRSSGDCAGASPLFEKAYALFPGALGPLRNAAECEEATGRWATARRSWLELKRAMLLSNDPKYAGWDADADAAAKRLASRISHLTVDVSTGGHDSSALEVTVNGDVLQTTLVNTTLDRDPGSYVVRAHIGAGEAAEQKIDLVTGESRTVHLVVAPPGQPLPEQPRVVIERSSGLMTAGWVTVAIGAAAFVGMGIAIGVRQDALSSLTSECSGYASAPCEADKRGVIDPIVSRGNAASTAVTALAVGGGILAGAGVVMLIVSMTQPRERRVAFGVSPFGANLLVRFE